MTDSVGYGKGGKQCCQIKGKEITIVKKAFVRNIPAPMTERQKRGKRTTMHTKQKTIKGNNTADALPQQMATLNTMYQYISKTTRKQARLKACTEDTEH